MNKNIAIKIAVCFVFMLTLEAGHVFAKPPEIQHIDKINANAVKRFRYVKTGKESFSLHAGLTISYPGTVEEAAKAFIKENHKLFKVSENLSELRLISNSKNHPDTYSLRFQQEYQGVPVYRASIKIEMNEKNQIISAGSSIVSIDNLNTIPAIKPDELQEIVSQAKPELEPLSKVKLIIYFIEYKPTLCYSAWSKVGNDPYYTIIDASTGEIVHIKKMSVE